MSKKDELPHKNPLLPHYYRLITAWVKNHLLLVLIILESVVLAAACIGLFIVYAHYENAKTERNKQVSQLLSWEEAIIRHPSYPQAYYNAALHAARVGDSQKALTYIQKALSLNENYEPAKQLKKLLAE